MTEERPGMSAPATTIRNYLDSHDGSVVVPFKHLLTTWQVEHPSAEARQAISRELTAAGVKVDGSLVDVDASDHVRLTVHGNGVSDAPPWAADGPEGEGAPPAVLTTPRVSGEGINRANSKRRSKGKRLAVAATVLVLGAGVATGGYFLGKNSGEDLDAARAFGARQGQREGAARGAERGYEQGLRRGRRQGYRQSYGPAFDKAYNGELKKAGFEPVKNPSRKK
jgi:hypothetical protein